MGEFTTCNFCRLKDIRRRAKEKGQKVTLRASGFWGGKDVYVHPKDVKIPTKHVHQDDNKEGPDEYWVAWMWEIPERCCC